VEFHASLKSEASGDLQSGFSGPGTNFRGLLETDMGVDLHKAAGWRGAQVFASFHDYFESNTADGLMGNAQGFSNIDSYPVNRIYELWFQQSLAQDKLRMKVGRIDANTEFARVENAGEFLNSSMGYSPTILYMNSYPHPRSGAVVVFAPVKFFSYSSGIFRCLPGGSMVLNEAGTRWRISDRFSGGRLAFGFWIHPNTLNGFNGISEAGVHGYYAVLEQTLWKRAGEIDDDARGIRAFAQWGDANPWFSGVARHLGTGFEWAGAFSRRPSDVIGWGITTIQFGQDSNQNDLAGRERAIETFYKVPLKSWLSLTPDLQWIVNPSGSLERQRAIAATMRMVISF
jgi:carbohydrate-selective porin OprB